jgi:hypothetical protein
LKGDALGELVAKRQMIIFALSFVVHGLSELGLTSELITATFYKQVEVSNTRDDEDDDRNHFKYSNM